MHSAEQVEKVRQAIMRYRELLDVLAGRMAAGEKRYVALFQGLTPEQRASLPEKLQQREAARAALEDLDPLRRALLAMQFDLHDVERAFEEVYNNIAPDEPAE
ncbi:MAG: hypothetical protein MUE40_17135 [Anaerolineae bacterium]|jgi:hypothetical protein|nr:hypothetical protein [Anaerolineae bacterium]